MEWIGPIVAAIVGALLLLVKGLWGTSKPQETTVDHTTPDIEVTDGKTDKERLEDLGL